MSAARGESRDDDRPARRAPSRELAGVESGQALGFAVERGSARFARVAWD